MSNKLHTLLENSNVPPAYGVYLSVIKGLTKKYSDNQIDDMIIGFLKMILIGKEPNENLTNEDKEDLINKIKEILG
jgi:hypothetical protein